MKYNGYAGTYTLYVVEGNGPALVGRDWLNKVWLDLKAVALCEIKHTVEKYSQNYQSGLGTMTQIKAHLSLKPDTRSQMNTHMPSTRATAHHP